MTSAFYTIKAGSFGPMYFSQLLFALVLIIQTGQAQRILHSTNKCLSQSFVNKRYYTRFSIIGWPARRICKDYPARLLL